MIATTHISVATRTPRRPHRMVLVLAILCWPMVSGCQGTKEFLTDAKRNIDNAVGQGDSAAKSSADGATGVQEYDRGQILLAQGKASEAADEFAKAAEQSHAQATFELSMLYGEGRGVAKDLDRAATLTNKAARLGDARALYIVGQAYFQGDGVAQDYAVAADYLTRAANIGHARAQYLIGECYANGWGVDRHRAWAARWYGKAAYQGVVAAQYAYGATFGAGWGGPKNFAEAYFWLRLAARNGHGEAATLATAFGRRLSDERRAKALAKARAFQPSAVHRVDDRPSVRFVQAALAKLGYQPGPVDGLMGTKTRGAIAAYTQASGMDPTSDVNAMLLEALAADPSTD